MPTEPLTPPPSPDSSPAPRLLPGAVLDPNAPGCLDMHARPLSSLVPMRVAVIDRVDEDHDHADRLKSLGLCVGRKLQVIKTGDPLIVRVLGSRLGLSARLADRVYVTPCSISGPPEVGQADAQPHADAKERLPRGDGAPGTPTPGDRA